MPKVVGQGSPYKAARLTRPPETPPVHRYPALGLLALVCLASPAFAEALPKLFHVHPPGGQAGKTVEVMVVGADLGTVDRLWFSGPGVEATPIVGKPGAFRVTIAATVEPAVIDVRVASSVGVSNPRSFVVGNRPEANEVEPNDGPDTANRIEINSVVNGSITATDVDCFAIEGKAGRRILFDLAAERIDSKLDATIRLLDARGVELAESRDAFGADPFLDATLPADGRYVVKLHDVTYAGSVDHFYRLTIHDGPHIDAIRPAITEADLPRFHTIIGRNLGGRPIAERGVDGRPLEARDVFTLAEPFTDASALSLFATGSTIAIRGREVRDSSRRRWTDAVILAEAPGPIVAEREPDGPESPQDVTPPCSVGGDFQTPGDLDVYRFAAKKGETWRIEAIAEGIGSIADPTFIVQRLGTGEPVDLVAADDTADPGLVPRLNLASVDASMAWQAPADGRYQVIVSDVATASRGGPRLFYRLTIRRERPDFRLFLMPTTPNALDSLGLRKGGRGSAIVVAWRQEGFNAPIWVRPQSLPEGVRCPPVVIPPGQTVATVGFEADATAKPTIGVVRLVGFASTRVGSPLSRPVDAWLRPDRVHEATPVATIWPIQRGNPNSKATVAPIRVTRGFAVSVR